jgi:hypothetical protein
MQEIQLVLKQMYNELYDSKRGKKMCWYIPVFQSGKYWNALHNRGQNRSAVLWLSSLASFWTLNIEFSCAVERISEMTCFMLDSTYCIDWKKKSEVKDNLFANHASYYISVGMHK